MRTSLGIAIVGLSMLAASAAGAGDSDKVPASVVETLPSSTRDYVCRDLGPVTGTRLGSRRVCKTRAQWNLDRVNARERLEHRQITRGCTLRSCNE